MTTLYLLIVLNGNLIEHATVKWSGHFGGAACLSQAESNMKASPSTVWICKASQ